MCLCIEFNGWAKNYSQTTEAREETNKYTAIEKKLLATRVSFTVEQKEVF